MLAAIFHVSSEGSTFSTTVESHQVEQRGAENAAWKYARCLEDNIPSDVRNRIFFFRGYCAHIPHPTLLALGVIQIYTGNTDSHTRNSIMTCGMLPLCSYYSKKSPRISSTVPVQMAPSLLGGVGVHIKHSIRKTLRNPYIIPAESLYIRAEAWHPCSNQQPTLPPSAFANPVD